MSNCPICHKNEPIKRKDYDNSFIVEESSHIMEYHLYGRSKDIDGIWVDNKPGKALFFEICSNCGIQYCINLEDLKKFKKIRGNNEK